MPKPTTFAVGAACVGVIALLAILVLKRDKRPIPAPPNELALVTEPAPSEPKAIDEKPDPRPPAAAVVRPAVQAPVKPDARKPLDETSLLAQLHELAASNPSLSLKLAREAVNQFPDSPNAPEFEWNVVKALFNLGQLKDAEDEARIMLSKYPGNYFTGDVVHHLLNHPPNPSTVQ